MNIAELKEKSIDELVSIAKDLKLEGATSLRKQELIFRILQGQTEKNGLIFSEGVLEILPEGFGFLRAPDYNYLPGRHLCFAFSDQEIRTQNRRHRLGTNSSTQRRRTIFCSNQGRSHQLRTSHMQTSGVV